MQIPQLNSKPGAPKVIFLKFDGDTTKSWAVAESRTIVSDASGYNESQMVQIHGQVAADFNLFSNVTVTTIQSVYDAAALHNKKKVIVTPSNKWMLGGALGWACFNSFTPKFYDHDVPCFVFTNMNSNDPELVGKQASFQIGRSMGLVDHSDYDQNGKQINALSVGNGQWTPIMGAAIKGRPHIWITGNLVQTSGQTFTSMNFQDDVAILMAYNKLIK